MATPAAVLAVLRTARPTCRTPADAVALAVHATLLCHGFVLVAVGDAALRDVPADSAREASLDGWQALSDEYAFRYVAEATFPDARAQYVLKALATGSKLLLDFGGPAPAAATHLELRVGDFCTSAVGGDFHSMYSNLHTLVERVSTTLLSRPQQPREQPAQAAARGQRIAADEGRSSGRDDRGVERHEWRPEFHGVGDQDRFPHGMPSIPPLGPFGPGSQGGGMLVGPHHPGFWPDPGPPGGRRPPGVPPEARFDPFGPPGVPGFDAGTFGGEQRGRIPGIPAQPPRVHPDIMQPGPDDDAHLF